MPASAEQQYQTLQKFIKTLEVWKYEQCLALFDDNFQQVTLPLSLGVPLRERAQVEQVLPILMGAVTNYQIKFRHVLHDPSKNQASFYAHSTGDTPFGDWNMEYSAFLTFNEDGTKIARLEEAVDSAKMATFGPKFEEYVKEKLGH